MKLPLSIWFAVILMLFAPVQAQEIVDIYSDLQSCDVTVEGNAEGCHLELDLFSPRGVIQSESLDLDGPGTWILEWNIPNAEEGSYRICAALSKDGEALSQRCFDFYYGGRVNIRFDVRDFHADQKGMHLLVYSADLAVVDIYYMLIKDGKALYVSKEAAVPISGNVLSPSEFSWVWKQLLENNQDYSGRVKIVEKKNGQTRAFMNSFAAKDDAEITDTYEDETGASATVMGESRVPFAGALKFDLYQDGEFITSVEEKTPVLLADDDETVEISWDETLDPGIYELRISLLGNDGDMIDFVESIIEAEPRPEAFVVEPQEEDEDSTPTYGLVVGVLVLIVLAFVSYKIVKGRKS